MLRTPRNNPARCACGVCRTCTDPITANTAALRAAMAEPDAPRLGGRMVYVPARVAGPLLPPAPKLPARAAPDLDGFTDQMTALINEVRTGRADDGQGRR